MTEEKGKNRIAELKEKGWEEANIGSYKSGSRLKEKKGFKLYLRRRKLEEYFDDFCKMSSSQFTTNPSNTGGSDMGSSTHMGSPKVNVTPSAEEEGSNYNSFLRYPSLKAIRKEEPCLLIGFDAEWSTIASDRDMLSWQFALNDGEYLVEFVFLKDGLKNLSMSEAIGCILDHLDSFKAVDIRKIRRYEYCSDFKNGKPVVTITDDLAEAREKSTYVYFKERGFTNQLIDDMPDKSAKFSERKWRFFNTYYDYSLVDPIKICVVCHTCKVDLSSLNYDGDIALLRHLTDIQGGLVSLKPIRYAVKSQQNANNSSIYPVSLSVADTMCHAPAGKKSLKALGESIGIEKLDIPQVMKEHMDDLLLNDPALFFEYASTDSVITMLYASSIYGFNNNPPVTITSATAGVMLKTMKDYLKCESVAEFDAVYRGLETVNHGKFKFSNRPGFVTATSLEPMTNDALVVQTYASKSFHGGYNSCSEVGYFPFPTNDYDLKNAYPSAMCLVVEIDCEDPIRSEVIRRDMSLDDFIGSGGINPITPFVGYVRFEFPKNCKYPCIPVNIDGIPIYPLSSEGMAGVYAAGPYIWLALKLGAHVYCDRGYFLKRRYENNKETRSLAAGVKQLVVDRNLAKNERGKGSLEELILKTMVNSCYGKVAQNVIPKSSWSAWSDLMEDLGCSPITNPVSAMMITSIVQVELLAAQNQIQELGYMSCSVTTDGFISNCPEDILKSLDLYGLRDYMEEARIFLTDGDPELWEVKHHQDDLVNFTTRGNVSLKCKERDGYDGVCAHNSAKSGYNSDSYEDRLWLMTQVLSRTGTVDYEENEWTTFKDLVHGAFFETKPVERHIRMDFDFKRKPIRESFSTDKVSIDGELYEIAHFDTEPYKNIDEFKLYRKKYELTNVLRTQADWDIFWSKIELCSSKARPQNLQWSILNSCIMGYRKGSWDIPSLNGKSVKDKCEWINEHNKSGKIFKTEDWKNARKPERQANMLPDEIIKEKLEELMND